MSGTAAEAASFAALYTETSADVLAFLLRRCPTPEDAADSLAETYLVAWEKRNQIPAGEETRPWLFGVARNVMRRGHERHRRLAAATQSLADELQSAASARPARAPDGLESITAALSELSGLDQEIITMISWDELTPGRSDKCLASPPTSCGCGRTAHAQDSERCSPQTTPSSHPATTAQGAGLEATAEPTPAPRAGTSFRHRARLSATK